MIKIAEKEIYIVPSEEEVVHMALASLGIRKSQEGHADFLFAIQKLRSNIGEEVLKQKLGKDYDRIIEEFNEYCIYIGIIESYRESLDQRVINRKDIRSPLFIQFQKASAMRLICTSPFIIYKALLEESSMKNKRIPSTYRAMIKATILQTKVSEEEESADENEE